MVKKRVIDRFSTVIRFEMAFSNICQLVTIVDQDVVPRLVFGRSTQRDIIVPFIRELKVWINVDDHTAILRTPVVDHLADGKLSF